MNRQPSLSSRQAAVVLAVLVVVQAATHMIWLSSLSAHSGQVAIPWMMNHGLSLFDELLEQHAPGSSLVAALGQAISPLPPIETLRLMNTLLVVSITVAVFGLARHLSGGDNRAGLLASGVWFIWEPVFGNVMLYFNTLLGACLLLAAWLLSRYLRRDYAVGWLFAAGLLTGAATLFKQHAWSAAPLLVGWLLVVLPAGMRWRHVLLFGLGVLVLPGVLVLVMIAQGSLPAYIYWNWAFNFSGLMVNAPPGGDFVRKLALSAIFVPGFFLLLPREENWRAWLAAGLLWLAGSMTMLPRFGEISATGMLPLLAVLTGVTLAQLVPAQCPVWRLWLRQAAPVTRVLTGVGLVVLLAWGWTGIAPYATGALGQAGIPAHDEFKPLVARLSALADAGDTLFVLPETDSTPQIHSMAGLLPPGTWVKGWFWYLVAPDITAADGPRSMAERLLAEWQAAPPTWIVYFPDLEAEGQPGIEPLVAFMRDFYRLAETVPGVIFHGDALIYRLADA